MSLRPISPLRQRMLGRVHYADFGRLKADDVPQRGMLVALAGDETLRGKPTSVPRLEVLSAVELARLATYEGPTWLDGAIIGKFKVQNRCRASRRNCGRRSPTAAAGWPSAGWPTFPR